jgi:hypothetical protein
MAMTAELTSILLIHELGGHRLIGGSNGIANRVLFSFNLFRVWINSFLRSNKNSKEAEITFLTQSLTDEGFRVHSGNEEVENEEGTKELLLSRSTMEMLLHPFLF